MALKLNEIAPNKGEKKSKMRVGRGIGSGKGKTCGRGGKGQTSRSGVAIKGFEGGQTPIHRRLPKRGFKNPTRKVAETINIWELEKAIESGKLDAKKEITNDTLVQAGLIRPLGDFTKLLSKGEVKSKISITVDKASASAITAIESKGGKVTVNEVANGNDAKEEKESKKTKKTASKKTTSKVKKS